MKSPADMTDNELRDEIARLSTLLLARSMRDAAPSILSFGELTIQRFAEREIARYQNSFVAQDRREQGFRLNLVIRMSVEYAGLKEGGANFCMGFAHRAIALVMDGDVVELKCCRSMLVGEDADERTRSYCAVAYAKFVEMIDEALAHFETPVPVAPAEATH
jgi:hypothetical protein